MQLLTKLVDWHKGKTHHFQSALRLDDYHMMWISFMKGVILVLLLQWIF